MDCFPLRGLFLLLVAGLAPDALAQTNPPVAEIAHPREKFGDPLQYEVRDLPALKKDLLTLQRAAQLLDSEAVWNRNDDRECADDEAMNKRSLFCALHRASQETYGTHDSNRVADHRRLALQEVRFAIEEVTQGREFNHRLMDFNNLPETSFASIQQVLALATRRIQARLPPE